MGHLEPLPLAGRALLCAMSSGTSPHALFAFGTFQHNPPADVVAYASRFRTGSACRRRHAGRPSGRWVGLALGRHLSPNKPPAAPAARSELPLPPEERCLTRSEALTTPHRQVDAYLNQIYSSLRTAMSVLERVESEVKALSGQSLFPASASLSLFVHRFLLLLLQMMRPK